VKHYCPGCRRKQPEAVVLCQLCMWKLAPDERLALSEFYHDFRGPERQRVLRRWIKALTQALRQSHKADRELILNTISPGNRVFGPDPAGNPLGFLIVCGQCRGEFNPAHCHTDPRNDLRVICRWCLQSRG